VRERNALLVLATSNAEQVRLIRSIFELLSINSATPAETQQMIAFKGGDNVRF
jgi:uncharacterized protein (DUF849 family)